MADWPNARPASVIHARRPFKPDVLTLQFLEAHCDVYYDRLLAITDRGDWQSWVGFFVEAVVTQAESNLGPADPSAL